MFSTRSDFVGDNSAIEWTDATWNPVRGCTQISPGCWNCYAKHQAARIVRMAKGKPSKYDGLVRIIPHSGEPAWTGRVDLDPVKLAEPLRWTRPRRIFVNSMSDLFHESLTDEQIALVFGVALLAAQHTYQALTKRADRMRRWFSVWSVDACIDAAARFVASDGTVLPGARPHNRPSRREWFDVEAWPVPWIWPGVSVEDRKHGVPRIGDLKQVPATVRMLSFEPLLEDLGDLDLNGIGWAIAGCESSQGGEAPRPAEDAWFESIATQCQAAGVPYFHKQSFVDGKLCHALEGFPPALRSQEFPR
jgi:protein gp37